MSSQSFKTYVSGFFETDDIKDSTFCKEFLTKPNTINAFFNTIEKYMETSDNPGIPIYKQVNIITLLCAAVYQLSQQYLDKYPSAVAKTVIGNLYITPFSTFLEKIIDNTDIALDQVDFMQHKNGLLRPFTYLMLLCNFTQNMKYDSTPIYIFMNKLMYTLQNGYRIDALVDVIKPIIEFDFEIDYFYVGRGETIFSSLDGSLIFFDKQSIYSYILPKLNNEVNNEEFETFNKHLFLNNIFDSFLYDIDDGAIQNNGKWQSLLNVLWFKLEHAYNFQQELPNMFGLLLHPSVDPDTIEDILFIKKDVDESILFPMIRNKYYDDDAINAMYVKNLIKAVINHKYSKVHLGDFFRLIFESPSILLRLNTKNNDILLEILEINFEKNNSNNVNMSVSYNSPWFDKQNTYSFSESKSYDEYDDLEITKAYFKQILQGLIKTVTRNFKHLAYNMHQYRNSTVRPYFEKLFSYTDALKEIDIDIEKMPELRKVVLYSPLQKTGSRSVDRDTRTPSPKATNNLFQDFSNPTLLKKLSKLYVRSVQSDDQTENNYKRIINIRKYLIHKYKKKINYDDDFMQDPSIHKIKNVVPGQELNRFYKFWKNTIKKQNLLEVRFIVYYQDTGRGRQDIALDYGGLTRHFLTKLSKQILRYFKLVDNSARYILDSNKTTPDQAVFISQLLSLFIVNNIYIAFPISYLYLGYLMFDAERISIEEQFLYFILDLHKKKAEANLQLCTMPSDEEYDPCGPDELQRFISLTYTTNQAVFETFINNFFNKKIFYSKFASIHDKIRIYDLDKLLTVREVSNEEYKKYLFDKITLRIKTSHTPTDKEYDVLDKSDDDAIVYTFLQELFTAHTSFDEFYENCTVDDSLIEKKEKFKKKIDFCKAILLFWTGVEGIISSDNYIVTIDQNESEIKSHTCFNDLILPLGTNIKAKQDLYNAFMLIFIYDAQDVFGQL